MGNPVVHFEINSGDPAAGGKFYSSLFGWHVQSMPEMGYEIVDTHGGGGINGGLGKTEETPFVTFYVEADDLQAVLDKAEGLGAKTVMPVTEIPGIVTLAQFADPSGNVIGLVKSDPNQDAPGVSEGGNPQVGWFEVLSPDAKSLWVFYEKLFGWKVKAGDNPNFVYGEVDTGNGEKSVGGGIGEGPDGAKHVTVYASVDDVKTYLDKAAALGAKPVMGPQKVDDHLEVGLFIDPQGAPFGLFAFKH